jgi:hypothetical protein
MNQKTIHKFSSTRFSSKHANEIYRRASALRSRQVRFIKSRRISALQNAQGTLSSVQAAQIADTPIQNLSAKDLPKQDTATER